MFQSFFGPTFSEVSNSVLHLFSFVESLVILIILMAIVLVRLPRLPVFIFITATFSLVMILFVNYPFGIMNPGSAIRYRTGYFPIVIFIIIVLTSRSWSIMWLESIVNRQNSLYEDRENLNATVGSK